MFPTSFSAYSVADAKVVPEEDVSIPSFVLVEDQAKSLRLSGDDALAPFMDIYGKGELLGTVKEVVEKYGDECICIIRHGSATTAHVTDTRKVYKSVTLRRRLVPATWNEISKAVHLDAVVDDPSAQILVFVHPTQGNEAIHNVVTFFSKESYVTQYLSAIRHIDSLMLEVEASALDPLIRGIGSEILQRAKLTKEDKETAASKYEDILSAYMDNDDEEEQKTEKEGEEKVEPTSDEILKTSLNKATAYYHPLPAPDPVMVDDICETTMTWAKSPVLQASTPSPITHLLKHPQGVYAIKQLSDSGARTAIPLLETKLPTKFLNVLSSQEIRTIITKMKGEDFQISHDEPFIFSLKSAANLCHHVLPCSNRLDGNFVENLNEFVGGILDKINLKKCMITGSAIPACLYTIGETASDKFKAPCNWFHTRVTERYAPWNMVNITNIFATSMTDVRYTHSRIYFTAANRVLVRIYGRSNSGSNDEICMLGYEADIEAGSDVDIAVDTVADEELYAEAQSIFKAVKGSVKFPVLLEKVEKARGIGYRVVADPNLQFSDPKSFLTFRPLEIYKCNFARICTHHLAPVRAAYTAKFTGQPELWMTATCLQAMVTGFNVHYWYFSSTKATAARIINKYKRRGFRCHPTSKKARDIIDAERLAGFAMGKFFLLPNIEFESQEGAEETSITRTSVLPKCTDCREHFAFPISVGLDRGTKYNNDVGAVLSVTSMRDPYQPRGCYEVGCYEDIHDRTRCYNHGERVSAEAGAQSISAMTSIPDHPISKYTPRDSSDIVTIIQGLIPQPTQPQIVPTQGTPMIPFPQLPTVPQLLRPISPLGPVKFGGPIPARSDTCIWTLVRGPNAGTKCGKPTHKNINYCFQHRYAVNKRR